MNIKNDDIIINDLTKLKRVRLKANLRVLDISLSTDISIGNISNLENGNRNNPKIETLKRYLAPCGYELVLIARRTYIPKKNKKIKFDLASDNSRIPQG